MNEAPTTPVGYMKNAAGHLVPREAVREQDLLRNEVAIRLARRAEQLSQALAEYKRAALAEIDDLVQIAADRYDAVLGGRKGNVSITSYDGEYRIVRQMAERIAFTEEIEAAKALINQCITRWSEGASDNIRILVDRAFRTDTKGQLKTASVLELMRLDIEDNDWQMAMLAIKDAIQTVGTATYVRVYRRIGVTDQYSPVPLDLATV